MAVSRIQQNPKEYTALSTDDLSVVKDAGSRIYLVDLRETMVVGPDSKLYSLTGESSKGFNAYRDITSGANQEILKYNMFNPTKQFRTYKLMFLPDAPCNVIINSNPNPIFIEGSFELDNNDMDVTSLKIVESGIHFYIQYYVVA